MDHAYDAAEAAVEFATLVSLTTHFLAREYSAD